MISKKEVQHIAQLARLGLKKDEISKMEKDLSLILDYFGKMKEVDTSKVDLYLSSEGRKHVIREDKEKESDEKISKKLLEEAPEEKNRYIKVKKVF
jgi:aspartyl-tRNA(Asn)/glutamyl-tRNA(Gln) amidotransferase subunit C